MDAADLISASFWQEKTPQIISNAAILLPKLEELENHLCFSTSGSMNAPKLIALSKRALLISAQQVNQHLHVTGESHWGLVLPIHHVGGFGVIARAHQARCRISQMQTRWNALDFADFVNQKGITHTSLVPTQVFDIVQHNLIAPKSLIAVIVGGGNLQQELGERARKLGWPVLASYGMTEACSQIATQSLSDLLLPYRNEEFTILPHWELSLANDDCLKIQGNALFTGWLEIDDATLAYKWKPRLESYWVTQDRVKLSSTARRLTFLGRKDTHVKILGELVDIERIERELLEAIPNAHHGQIAIIPIPHERKGHELLPVLERSINYDQALLAWQHYHISAPGYRTLLPFLSVDQIPKSELGKIRRHNLWLLPEIQKHNIHPAQ